MPEKQSAGGPAEECEHGFELNILKCCTRTCKCAHCNLKSVRIHNAETAAEAFRQLFYIPKSSYAGQGAAVLAMNTLMALIAGLLFGNLLLPARRNL